MSRYSDTNRDGRLMAYDARKKSLLIAYIFWFFIGMFGVHRIYVGKWVTGLLFAGLTIIGGALTIVGVGFLLLGVAGLWWLIDAILTYMMVERYNESLARDLS